MSSAPILIVGSGVAGLTLARTLSRSAVPFRLIAPPAARVDRGLGLWGRSQVALAEIGLSQLLETRAHRIPAAAYRSHAGTWLSRCSDSPRNSRRVATLRESDLLAALRGGLPPDSVVDGSVAAVENGSDGVSVRLEDGQAAEGSVVVGADGVGSTVRRLLWPGGAPAVDLGLVSAGGIAEHGFGDHALAFETLSGGSRFALVPLSDGACFWFATRPSDSADASSLEEAYAGWHAPIPEVLRAAADDELRWERLRSVATLDAWSTGRAVLVGDAAHALPINLAQGAAAAIEGAYLLGTALARCGGDHAAAFRAYEAAAAPRVAQCRRVTAFTELLAAPAGPVAEGARNAMALVPAPINGFVFDSFLEYSLGDVPSATAALWPLRVRLED
jgi:2-polyprenyl-6-methoxyphenol hydroxylase-like FAD-dependent oxidoreductase